MLREGVSTGSCAAAAAKAAALWLTTGRCPERVEIETPVGRTLSLEIVPQGMGRCGVVKDAGDDPDATNGLTVSARVELMEREGGIEFRAGEGVGVATLPGLKVPVGDPAINPVPRRMIAEALRGVVGPRAAVVTISVPGGEEVARRTFNPRLGIVGGISILGTRGIVRPMDERSIAESLTLELNTHAAQGKRGIVLTFGNTGELALRKAFDLTGRCVLQVGNRIGFVLDEARRLGFERTLLCGHPGKLLKVAAGSFDTHNRVADGRMEALCTHAALLGMEHDSIRKLYACATAEGAIELVETLTRDGGRTLWDRLAEAAAKRCADRSFGELTVGAAFIGNDGTILGESEQVKFLMKEIKMAEMKTEEIKKC
jgi:cobalt-precorrin-5B (C1)-methyltransferase